MFPLKYPWSEEEPKKPVEKVIRNLLAVGNYTGVLKIIENETDITEISKQIIKEEILCFYFDKALTHSINQVEVKIYEKIMKIIMNDWPDMTENGEDTLMCILGSYDEDRWPDMGVKRRELHFSFFEGLEMIGAHIQTNIYNNNNDYYKILRFLINLEHDFMEDDRDLILKWCEKKNIIKTEDAYEIIKIIKGNGTNNELQNMVKNYLQTKKIKETINAALNSTSKNNNLKL